MLETTKTRIAKLEDKKLDKIMQKLQEGKKTTQKEKDKLFNGLLKEEKRRIKNV